MRSNLIGMGVLPLTFVVEADYDKVAGLHDATFSITGLSNEIAPRSEVTLTAKNADGTTVEVPVVVRLDTPVEIDYYRAGGILPYVLAQILKG
jgi:aconitate hydratase